MSTFFVHSIKQQFRVSGIFNICLELKYEAKKGGDCDLIINEIPGVIELSDLTTRSISEIVDNSLSENGDFDIVTHPVAEQYNEPQKKLEDEDNASDLKINEIPSLIELSDLTKISISEIVDNSLCENGESDITTHPVSEQKNGLTLEDEDNATGKSKKDNGAEKEFDVLPDKDEQPIVIGSEISESGHRFPGEQDVENPVSSAPPKELDDDLIINEIPGVIELSDLTTRSISEIVDNSLSENGDFDIVTHPVAEQYNEPQKKLEDEDNATGKTNKDNGTKKEFEVLPDKDEQTIVIGSEISESGHRFPGEQDVENPVSSAPPKELDDNLIINEIPGVIELSELTKRSISEIVDNSLCENGESSIVTHPVSEQHNGLNLEDNDNGTGKSTIVIGARTKPDFLPDEVEETTVIGSEISESKHRFPDDPISNTISNLTKRSVTGIDDNALSENGEFDIVTHPISERPNGLQINFKDDDNTSAVQYRPDVNTGKS
ncbi:uncharacterized protein LOC108153914 [Drosophila miranda]|uniref:uncharacterized protein LOC108153914 n=1 Tax=Drosophila miranda TaxID=7229 RepID=UPI00143F9ACF|nr:uncharacterized protein LOC108153914 [Drosophila miranda]